MSGKVRVGISQEEAWPDYRIRTTIPDWWDDAVVEVDVDTLARWNRVIAEYVQLQNELSVLYEEAYQ